MSIKSPLSRQFGSRFDSVFDVVKSNPVYDKAGRIPTLDLNFAKSKSLYDGRSTKNLIDHVRDTAPNSSTYVDAAGLIKRSVTNLMSYSEDFSTTWTETNATVSTNQIAAPDGNITADKITESIDTGFHRVNQVFSHTDGKTYVGSAFVKAGERTKVHLQLGSNLFKISLFDLNAGTASGDGVIEDVGNGWYRCSLASTATTTNTASLFVEITNDAGDRNYEGDGTSGLYVWGAQVEEASTVGEYVKTTASKSSAPRFDHDPATGESLGLLVEESRTNLLTYSEQLDEQSTWTDVGTTWSANSIIAPDGTQTADDPGFVSAKWGFYDATNASWISGYPQDYPFTVTSEWVRYSATFTTPSGCTSLRVYPLRSSTDASYVYQTVTVTESTTYTASVYYKLADDGTTVIAWGTQLEEGSFSTSYIPTEGAAVTRGADVVSITGTNFSGFYSGTEHTFFSNSAVQDTQITQFVWSLRGGTYTTSLRQPQSGVSKFRAQVGDTFSTAPGIGDVSDKKASLAFSNTSASFQVSTTLDTFSVSNASDPTYLALGNYSTAGSNFLNGTISRLTYWDTRLSNEKLQSTTA